LNPLKVTIKERFFHKFSVFFLFNIQYKLEITPQKALEMLRTEGIDLTLEQAEQDLGFLRKLANIAVSKYLRGKDDNASI
jgi:hypothetical protein